MPDQIGFFKYIKDAVTGFFLTVDETALLSSKAPKASPVFTGDEKHGGIFTELFALAGSLDNTVAVNITFPSQATMATHIIELTIASISSGNTAYGGIARYVCTSTTSIGGTIEALTSDFKNATIGVGDSGLVLTVTMTLAGALAAAGGSVAYARVTSSVDAARPTGMTIT